MRYLGPFEARSRRRLIKDGLAIAGLAAGLGMAIKPGRLFAGDTSAPRPKRRMAIIGAGAGGVSTAYLCDEEWDIDLFEARAKLGGHSDSVTLDYKGRPITLDLGAQFFHRDTHPLYMALLSDLGLYQADQSAKNQVLEVKGSLTILDLQANRPLFVSKDPLVTPLRAIEFARYTRLARKLILNDSSYEIDVATWVADLPLSTDFRYRVLIPWLSAMIGTTVENAKQSSARSILGTFALAFPHNLLNSATTCNSRIGFQGNLQTMFDRCQNVRLHTSSPVLGMERQAGAWYLDTPSGRQGPFDHVVINAQPQYSKKWLAEVPGMQDLVAVLDRFRYFDARLVLHDDPIYVDEDRANWSVYNAGIDGDSCEGSVWVGGIHPRHNGKTIDLFKSWATMRTEESSNILAERLFHHPLITPDVIRAARILRSWQGVEGLSFAGQYTTGLDLQEAALYSATRVAQALAPRSSRLKSLFASLEARGGASLRYDP